jgi:hypothetical protein
LRACVLLLKLVPFAASFLVVSPSVGLLGAEGFPVSTACSMRGC